MGGPVKEVETQSTIAVDLPSFRQRRQSGEFVNIDRLRLLAVVDIVGFHIMNPLHPLGGFGLPAFLMFTVALNARRQTPESFSRMVARKLPWFLAPWLFWSAAYGAMQVLSAVHHHRPAFGWFQPTMLLTGTYWHLWYLPFAFLAVCATNLIHHFTARVSSDRLVAGSFISALVLLLIEHGHGSGMPPGAREAVFSAPSIPLGIALGRCLSMPPERSRGNLLFLLAGLAVMACVPLGIELGDEAMRRYGLTIVLACAVAAYSGPMDAVTRLFTSWRFGIYLVHPLVIHEYEALLGDRGGRWLEMLVVLVVSAAVVWMMQATPLRRLVPGGGGEHDEARERRQPTPAR